MLKNVLLEAVTAGAGELSHFFNSHFKISHKEGVNNLVTDADHAAEKAILEVIKGHFPDHYILTEESGEIVQDSEYKWIIDPIDGTVNFAHGIPLCCVSVAVEKRRDHIRRRLNPNLKEFFLLKRVRVPH
jgi:myo-inositol-1(or 4)-monophosphatase